MVKLTEPTKPCKDCGERKPWSDFYPNGRGYLDPLCKPCKNAERANRYRKDPKSKSKHNRTYHKKLVADLERHATLLERRRRQHREQAGITPDRYRAEKRAAVDDVQLLTPLPFAKWLRHVMERDELSILEMARRAGVSDKTLREILGGNRGGVALETVERALIADGTMMLRELYPDLYSGAA